MIRRAAVLYVGLFALIVAVGFAMGAPFTVRLLVEAAAYALIALGLNIQWGFGGLFNFGIMGFMMIGGFAAVFMAMPVSAPFWESDGPWMLAKALLAAGVGALVILGANRLHRVGLPKPLQRILQVIAWIAAYIFFRTQIDPAIAVIESREIGWVGGLGLPVWLGWVLGGALAAGVAWLIGKACLGLRSDYLAIATIGIAEIIFALLKNMDWLTRGTLTVSPVPWPVPLPQQYQSWGSTIDQSFIYARAGYLLLVLAILGAVFFLIQRAYGSPWGRMMRAIRDNHVAADAMGKDVRARQLQLFVLGSALMGVGGAILVSFAQIYDPSSYSSVNHTFIVWVMVIVGGAGNNLGALLGAFLIYIVWLLSEPVSQWLFTTISGWTEAIGWGAIPEITSRSVQMRVFVLGLVIVLALRFAPRGLIPETGAGRRPQDQPKQQSPDEAEV
jgi:branched-chain amino acid transport system permease protein